MQFQEYINESIKYQLYYITAWIPGIIDQPHYVQLKVWEHDPYVYYDPIERVPYDRDSMYLDVDNTVSDEYEGRDQSGEYLRITTTPVSDKIDKRYLYSYKCKEYFTQFPQTNILTPDAKKISILIPEFPGIIQKHLKFGLTEADKKALNDKGFWKWYQTLTWTNINPFDISWKINPYIKETKVNKNDKRLEFYNRFYADLHAYLPFNEWIPIRYKENDWRIALPTVKYNPTPSFIAWYNANISTKSYKFYKPSASILYRAIPKFVQLGYMEAFTSDTGEVPDNIDAIYNTEQTIYFKLIKDIKDLKGPGTFNGVLDVMTDLF